MSQPFGIIFADQLEKRSRWTDRAVEDPIRQEAARLRTPCVPVPLDGGRDASAWSSLRLAWPTDGWKAGFDWIRFWTRLLLTNFWLKH